MILFMWIGSCLYAQNTTSPPPSTTANGTFSTSPTTNGNINNTGSTSGVNPAGNPGTIISSSSISNQNLQPNTPLLNNNPVPAANTTINGNVNTNAAGTVPQVNATTTLTSNGVVPAGTANANAVIVEPGTKTINGNVNTSAAGTVPPVTTTTTLSGSAVNSTANESMTMPVGTTKEAATISSNQNTTTNTAVMNSEVPAVTGTANNNMNTNTTSNMNSGYAHYSETVNIGMTRFAAMPVLTTYVPDEVVSMLKNKYGDKLYDITRLNATGTEQYKYIVRFQENGIYNTETVDGQGVAMK